MRDDKLREIIELMLWKGTIASQEGDFYKVYIVLPFAHPLVIAVLYVNTYTNKVTLVSLDSGAVRDLRPEQEEELVNAFKFALENKLFEKGEWERWQVSRKYISGGIESLQSL